MPDPEKFDAEAYLDLLSISGSVQLMAELEEAIRQTVHRLRLRFVPWVDIAEELGVSRQAAQQRYGVDPTPSQRARRGALPDQLSLTD